MASRKRHGADSVFVWLRGRAHATPRIPSEDVRGRRSRVVPAPGGLASSLGGDVWPTGTRIDYPQGDGGNSATLPEESTKDTVKTIRAGKAGRSGETCSPPRVHLFWRTDLRVPAGARPSLRPCLCRGRHLEQDSGETRREKAMVRLLDASVRVLEPSQTYPAPRAKAVSCLTASQDLRHGRGHSPHACVLPGFDTGRFLLATRSIGMAIHRVGAAGGAKSSSAFHWKGADRSRQPVCARASFGLLGPAPASILSDAR
ncbi:hypothetical protein GGD62_001282 [Bradyrhizobium sp. ERR14]|nr:hypothetical protein [Bradyrhizobium sp. ERR14]